MAALQVRWLWPRRQQKGGKKAPGSPKISKVSNNFAPSVRRNPSSVAKQDGMSKSEVAGGTPRKKVQNVVSHALRVDREKAKIAQTNSEHKGLVNADDPNEWSGEGWFKKGQVKNRRPPKPQSLG